MEIVTDYPPIWDEANARFNIGKRAVIFAWGNRIFNPNGCRIEAPLLAHETAHGQRQGSDIMGWWRRYFDDPAFRLAEEIPAHQAEYLAALKNAPNRQRRRACEKAIAGRLAGPLYGGMISLPRARRLLREAEAA